MPCEALSPREAEVLTLIARGQSNQQIAKAMAISQWTVKAYIQHIFAKLNVPNPGGCGCPLGEAPRRQPRATPPIGGGRSD